MMDALVVLEDPLVFDLLIGIDTIKALGEMSISNSGEVWFTQKPVSVCVAAPVLSIEELDFHVRIVRGGIATMNWERVAYSIWLAVYQLLV